MGKKSTKSIKVVSENMSAPVRFFLAHAGYSYDPQVETKAQGKRRAAESLARAEEYAEKQGWTVSWEQDEEPYETDDADDKPTEVLGCVLKDADGEVLGSLWGIGDPSREYSRIVAAELAFASMPTFTVEPGRCILRNGAPYIAIHREGNTTPVDADEVTHAIAAFLNGRE